MSKLQKLELTWIGKDEQHSGVYLQGIAGKTLQEIEGLEFPALEDGTEE